MTVVSRSVGLSHFGNASTESDTVPKLTTLLHDRAGSSNAPGQAAGDCNGCRESPLPAVHDCDLSPDQTVACVALRAKCAATLNCQMKP
jgi:hypothetical protein